ncbi:MAG TPA: hypothetical protein VFX65_05500 [Candidatus Limnocylindrales bacterium]|nr:hypothetical protein [Candidatus Limnocylindrales bacterium]
MQIQDPVATTSRGVEMQEGDDFVCPNCGCEIRLRHHGNPERMHQMRPFTCCCGSPMTKEQRAEA